MVYNPARAHGAANKRKRHTPAPGSGIRHSDIIAKSGIRSVTLNDYKKKIVTDRGWKIDHFKGETYEMVYEFICSRNSTGLIKNPVSDRTVYVLSGQFYLTVSTQTTLFHSGQSFSIPKDVEYCLATDGHGDAEILFCQGANYEETLEKISSPSLNAQSDVVFSGEISRPNRRENSIARKQAQMLAVQQAVREKSRNESITGKVAKAAQEVQDEVAERSRKTPITKRQPLPGQSVTGVSPKPVGDGGYRE